MILAGSESVGSQTHLIGYDVKTKTTQVLYETTPFDYNSATIYPGFFDVRYNSASKQLAFTVALLTKGDGKYHDFGLHLLNTDDLSVKELCKSGCSQPRL